LKLLAASLFHSWNWSNPTLCLLLSLSFHCSLVLTIILPFTQPRFSRSFSLSSYLSRNPGLVGSFGDV
jgi:hypothetical protein